MIFLFSNKTYMIVEYGLLCFAANFARILWNVAHFFPIASFVPKKRCKYTLFFSFSWRSKIFSDLRKDMSLGRSGMYLLYLMAVSVSAHVSLNSSLFKENPTLVPEALVLKGDEAERKSLWSNRLRISLQCLNRFRIKNLNLACDWVISQNMSNRLTCFD